MGIGTVILLLLTVFMTPLTEANHFTLAIFHTTFLRLSKKNCARQHWLDVLSTTYFQKANFKKKIFTL